MLDEWLSRYLLINYLARVRLIGDLHRSGLPSDDIAILPNSQLVAHLAGDLPSFALEPSIRYHRVQADGFMISEDYILVATRRRTRSETASRILI